MLRIPSVSLAIPEPLAFLDATLLFIIQVLLARHPDLLTPPDSTAPIASHERRILDAVFELQYALDSYRIFVTDDTLCPECFASCTNENDIPF